LWAWLGIFLALVANGLVLRWLGGFGAAGAAIERWGNHSARSWARRHGISSL
jgi:hypothetical protein